MFNRTVWLFTLLFWLAVLFVAGWQGVVIIGAFSVCWSSCRRTRKEGTK